jgi:predicted nuclease of predicted toxin-antitoxin system
MRFKVDENLPIEVVELLSEAGHGAVTVQEQQMRGSDDAEVATICREEERILVTLDLDFADIRSYPPSEYPGLVVLRLKQQDKPHVLGVFSRLVGVFQEESVESSLWIVEEGRIRIRV